MSVCEVSEDVHLVTEEAAGVPQLPRLLLPLAVLTRELSVHLLLLHLLDGHILALCVHHQNPFRRQQMRQTTSLLSSRLYFVASRSGDWQEVAQSLHLGLHRPTRTGRPASRTVSTRLRPLLSQLRV